MYIIDKIGYFALSVILSLGLYIGYTAPIYFNDVFTVEDGLVEYGTAIALLLTSLLCIYRFLLLRSVKPLPWTIGTLLFALVFFFGAGEEISWGQRLLNIESNAFFLENNAQKEINLHNLVVGGNKINKLIFSKLLIIVMLIYLIVIPIVYRSVSTFKTLVDRYAVPVVNWHHTIAFIGATAMVIINPSERKWELYELAFGVIFFLIFMHPLNRIIYIKRMIK